MRFSIIFAVLAAAFTVCVPMKPSQYFPYGKVFLGSPRENIYMAIQTTFGRSRFGDTVHVMVSCPKEGKRARKAVWLPLEDDGDDVFVVKDYKRNEALAGLQKFIVQTCKQKRYSETLAFYEFLDGFTRVVVQGANGQEITLYKK